MTRSAQLRYLVALAALFGCAGQADETPTPSVSKECLAYYGDRQPYTPTEFPVEVVIDTSVDNESIARFLEAIDLWNDRLNSEVLFATITADTYGMHGDCNYATVNTTARLPDIDVGLTSHAQCAADRVDIAADPYLSERELRIIAAHEFGHVLGAPHDDRDSTSIMYPKLVPDMRLISERSTCLVKIALAAAAAP